MVRSKLFAMKTPLVIAILLLPVAAAVCIAQSEIPPADPDSLLACGYSYLRHGNTDSARILFTMVLSSQPHVQQAQLGLVRVEIEERDWQDAAALCDKLLKAHPDDIAANYYGGICEREKAPGKQSWAKARKHFEAVLARDSLYKDVLYQYALLKECEDELPEAIGLGLRQVRLRPELVDAQLGLLHLYRHYLAETKADVAMLWLGGQDNDYGRYFAAEALRRTKQFALAETTLFGLLNRTTVLPRQAYDLSLAHMYAIAGKTTAAQERYWIAVDDIATWLGAAIMFEELKYIITDEELAEYRKIHSDHLKIAFFRRFWESRDPMPATAVNYRLIEHLRRYVQAEEQFEYYGPRLESTNPDWVHALTLPESFHLNREFNDLGVVYLRQGPPNSIERTVGEPIDEGNGDQKTEWNIIKHDPYATPMSRSRDQKYISKSAFPETNTFGLTAIDPHQSWIYYASGGEPQRIIHFALHNTSRNYWRLTPLPGQFWNLDDEMLAKLEAYDASYTNLLKAQRLETTLRAAEVEKHEKEIVATALTTDRHAWSNGTKEMLIPHAIDAFRNPAGNTLLDVSYAIPYAQLREAAGSDTKSIAVEVGMSVVSCTKNRVIDSRRDTLELLFPPDGKGSHIGLFRQILAADSVRLTAHVRALNAQALGTWSERLRVPAFMGRNFMISDLQFLLPASHGPVIEIDGVKVEQSPFTSYPRTKPLYVYVQIYNLVEDDFGAAGYTATFTIAPRDDPDDAKVLAEIRRDLANETAGAVFQMLDVRGIGPGRYVLTTRVTDRKRVQTLTRSREVEIVR